MESGCSGVVFKVEILNVVGNSGLKTNENWWEQSETNCNWTFYDNDGDNEAHDLAPLV